MMVAISGASAPDIPPAILPLIMPLIIELAASIALLISLKPIVPVSSRFLLLSLASEAMTAPVLFIQSDTEVIK
jgi:hypothetical protein